MKKEIHPELHKDAKTTCACGATYNIASTKKEQEIEICAACHPFYTGQEKVVDTAGRVEKFKQRMAKATKNKE